MLYCVLVSSGQNYSWGRKQEPIVHSEDGWQVWEAKDRDSLMEDIWEARCEAASGMDVDGWTNCPDCGYEDDDEVDGAECPECGASMERHEEEWADHVENNSYFEMVEYDPTNPNHARCKNWNTTIHRLEHVEAVEQKEREKIAFRVSRIKDKLRTNIQTIESLEYENQKLADELRSLLGSL